MIAILDSGVGGLSVFREIFKLLPEASYLYISDSKYCPYGPKSKEEIINRLDKLVQYSIDQGAEMIVIACNTATAVGIEYLRAKYKLPFVGMEPAVKSAANISEKGVIGVLATRGTLKGELYHQSLEKYASNVEVIEQAGVGLVELVEKGILEGPELEMLLRKYIGYMVEKGVDTIVLGCTHYPFLIKTIRSIYGQELNLIDPAPAIAQRCLDLIKSNNFSEKGNKLNIYTTGESFEILEKLVKENIKVNLNSKFANLDV